MEWLSDTNKGFDRDSEEEVLADSETLLESDKVVVEGINERDALVEAEMVCDGVSVSVAEGLCDAASVVDAEPVADGEKWSEADSLSEEEKLSGIVSVSVAEELCGADSVADVDLVLVPGV